MNRVSLRFWGVAEPGNLTNGPSGRLDLVVHRRGTGWPDTARAGRPQM